MQEVGPSTAALVLAYRAIQKSKLVINYGTHHLSRLKVEVEDLHNQIRGSQKAIAETRAFLERLGLKRLGSTRQKSRDLRP